MDRGTLNDLNLDSLDELEQRKLYDRLAYKFSGDEAANLQLTDTDREIWDAMEAVLQGKYCRCTALSVFKKSYGKAKLQKDLDLVARIFHNEFRSLRRLERLAILNVAFQCLADLLEEWSVPLSQTALLNNAGNMAYAIDQAYPGYRQANLLHKIINAGKPKGRPIVRARATR